MQQDQSSTLIYFFQMRNLNNQTEGSWEELCLQIGSPNDATQTPAHRQLLSLYRQGGWWAFPCESRVPWMLRFQSENYGFCCSKVISSCQAPGVYGALEFIAHWQLSGQGWRKSAFSSGRKTLTVGADHWDASLSEGNSMKSEGLLISCRIALAAGWCQRLLFKNQKPEYLFSHLPL